MGYQIYITDGNDVAELDTEQVDVYGIFSISDIQDISARKDDVKQIKFKGTKTNNNAFGTFFDFSRTTNFDIANAMGFNYNPLRPVTALVYDDSNLIFKGSLRIIDMDVDGTGSPIYNTLIRGAFLDFKTVIQDKYLTDLDFSDLKHRYSITAITNSWATSTERYDVASSAYTSSAFAYGSGYVYPNIDYGYYFSGSSDVNIIHYSNFKPAIFVTEIFDRIFSQDGLSGFTYEIKGSPELKEMINHLIIPDCQEGFKNQANGFVTTYSLPFIVNHVVNIPNLPNVQFDFDSLIPINNVIHPPADVLGHILEPYHSYSKVLSVQRNFNATAKVTVSLTTHYSTIAPAPHVEVLHCFVKLVKRNQEDNESAYKWETTWSPIAQKEFLVNANVGNEIHNLTFNVAKADYLVTEQLAVMVSVQYYAPFYYIGTGTGNGTTVQQRTFQYTTNGCVLSIPSDSNQFVSYDLNPNSVTGDTITPQAPVSIKQTDFLRSFMNQFNMYAYSTNDNHKHLIFQKYDDYYVYANPEYIKNAALDWTHKIDYTSGFKIKSNIDLPKSYLFTYKEDGDYLTDNYKKTFNEVYGQFGFGDQYGLLDTKKLELIFSPTILTTETGTDRKYPLLYKVESDKKKVAKTNIRMAYYNGLQPCVPYSISYKNVTDSIISVYTGDTYPQISNYYLSGTSVVNDIHFNQPLQTYFTASSDYYNPLNSYSNYYISQVTNLTNQDVTYVTCNALLNEIDIANLDLRIPIYINTGKMNGAYFKLLSVEYTGNESTSKLSLQKIAF